MSRASGILLRGAVAAATIASGCVGSQPEPEPGHPRTVVEVGRQAATEVHLHEKHSSALIAWRQDGVRDRILVHLDAHLDLDWLPDETVARIAASRAGELADLELDPYSLDEAILERFATSNFLYPAFRLGIVREVLWVVPDRTLADPASMHRLVNDVLVGRLQMVTEQEAASFRSEGRKIRGTLLGVPITICTLADLPELSEPVLLDIDLDYFTTPQATSSAVNAIPWIHPQDVLQALGRKRLRTDLITLSLSTIGGAVPPESRWLARDLQERLREPTRPTGDWDEMRFAAEKAEAAADYPAAVDLYRQMVLLRDDDATLWYALGRALSSAGRPAEGSRARAQAEHLDPLLTRADLFEGDREWRSDHCDAAVRSYDLYLERFPRGDFAPYAHCRRAGCLARMNRIEEATGEYRKVVELAPRNAETRVELGILLRDHGDLPGAVEQLRAARRVLPEVAYFAMALGTTYAMQGKVEDAVAELEDAVLRRPCYVQAQGSLAIALFQLGRFEEAARHVRVALALQPGNPRLRALALNLRRHGATVDFAAGP